MKEDPIVEEIQKIRDEYAARFGYDLRKIFDALKRAEQKSGKSYKSYPPRRIANLSPDDKAND
jgi:hypothetical protein